MPAPPLPFFVILGRRRLRWYPCLEFTIDGRRETFLKIANRLVDEFAGQVVERYGGHGDADKEYWWIDIESKHLLLMRKEEPIGIGLLGDGPTDIELVARIAQRFEARFVGWRWRIWRLVRRISRPQEVSVG
ncbi:MAG: hypothetical protein M3552_08250 [Planctomycetota bacterium]|nr:hypothetical protein [Planctomycetaceae bacterium]MDQ3330630.1 hypothetical protein [Planctomycetota bacterium]